MSEALPVLSLWQPAASFFALGIRTIETRSWPAPKSIIGQRVAIHAAKRKPAEDQRVGAWTVHEMADGSWSMTVDDPVQPFRYIPLPLGAIVATARLAECIPITDSAIQGTPTISRHDGQYGYAETLWQDDGRACWPITDQLPYGDYTPGRWAWMLEDVEPVNPPVPFTGGQGFSRKWQPTV